MKKKDERIWIAGTSFENKEKAGQDMLMGLGIIIIIFAITYIFFTGISIGPISALCLGVLIVLAPWLTKIQKGKR